MTDWIGRSPGDFSEVMKRNGCGERPGTGLRITMLRIASPMGFDLQSNQIPYRSSSSRKCPHDGRGSRHRWCRILG